MFVGLVGFGATLVVFALSPWFWVSVVALHGRGRQPAGVHGLEQRADSDATVEEEYRGRV